MPTPAQDLEAARAEIRRLASIPTPITLAVFDSLTAREKSEYMRAGGKFLDDRQPRLRGGTLKKSWNTMTVAERRAAVAHLG